MMTPIFRAGPETRAMAALRAMLARNVQAQAAVSHMSTRPEADTFDRALEALIVAAWKGEDITRQRETVKRLHREAAR